MFRRIWTTVVLLATALGFAADTLASQPPVCRPTIANRLSAHATTEGHALHRPAKDYAARILVSLGASYFATLLLLIFQP